MQPEDYQQGQGTRLGQQQPLPSFKPVGGDMGGISSVQLPAPPQGELVRIYERLSHFHTRICDSRDKLIALNERLGVRHIPISGEDGKASQPPQSEAILPAIDSFLALINDGLGNLEYQLERTLQL